MHEIYIETNDYLILKYHAFNAARVSNKPFDDIQPIRTERPLTQSLDIHGVDQFKLRQCFFPIPFIQIRVFLIEIDIIHLIF